MIIGITGLNATGKDTVAKFLEEKGFRKISLSEIVREELRKEGREITRENQQEKGDELRKENGADVLAKRAINKMKEGDYVVVSFRNTAEVEAFREKDDFVLVRITAPKEKRLQLAQKAREDGRTDVARTGKELKQMDERESSDKEHSQQLHKVEEMADVAINNDGTLEELREKTLKLVE